MFSFPKTIYRLVKSKSSTVHACSNVLGLPSIEDIAQYKDVRDQQQRRGEKNE